MKPDLKQIWAKMQAALRTGTRKFAILGGLVVLIMTSFAVGYLHTR